MKILACPACRDVLGLLGQEWRKCVCGASGGQYNADLMTATIGGQARVFGVANPFFLELFPLLNAEQRKLVHAKYHYGEDGNDCWWGEYPGDVQIFRIESPDGPSLKVKVTKFDELNNRVRVIDARQYTIDGKDSSCWPEGVVVPSNPNPFKRQLIRRKKGG